MQPISEVLFYEAEDVIIWNPACCSLGTRTHTRSCSETVLGRRVFPASVFHGVQLPTPLLPLLPLLGHCSSSSSSFGCEPAREGGALSGA